MDQRFQSLNIYAGHKSYDFFINSISKIMMIVKSEIGVIFSPSYWWKRFLCLFSGVQLGSSAKLTENNLNNKKHRQ